MDNIIDFSVRRKRIETDKNTMKEIEALAAMSEDEYRNFRINRAKDLCKDKDTQEKIRKMAGYSRKTYATNFYLLQHKTQKR